MPDGKIIEPYYVLEYPPWVNVVALTKENEVDLVRQYRHGYQKTLIELPAGGMEPSDKSSLEAAKRELLEETGYFSDDFRETCQVSANPASNNNVTHCFLALNAELQTTPRLDESEQITVVLKPLAEVVTMIKNRQFVQALHIAALFYAFSSLGKIIY